MFETSPTATIFGNYLSLELAKSETMVLIRVAPNFLIRNGKFQFRSCPVATPMMEENDLIYGKDWSEIINNFVDWRHNMVFIRSEDQLHTVSGDLTTEFEPCGMKDRACMVFRTRFL